MHRVAVVAFDGVVAFDLAVPLETLGRLRLPNGEPGYEVRVCGVQLDADAGAFVMRLRRDLAELAWADTIIVPGVTDLARPISAELTSALRVAVDRGVRIASICTGAFVLATAGVLDGRRATTHWLALEELARRFPRISVVSNVLFVAEGQVWSSAGAAAGIDLCLHMVRQDYGAKAGVDAAHLSVMPVPRGGQQPQTIRHTGHEADRAPLSQLMEWIEENLDAKLTLGALAKRGAVSVRTLSRWFREETGMSPLAWLLRARVQRAQLLLETTDLSLEQITSAVGFGTSASLRAAFRRISQTTPRQYRRRLAEETSRAAERTRSASVGQTSESPSLSRET